MENHLFVLQDLTEHGTVTLFSWNLNKKATDNHEMCEDIKTAVSKLQEKDSYSCDEAARVVEKVFEKHNQEYERFDSQTGLVLSN